MSFSSTRTRTVRNHIGDRVETSGNYEFIDSTTGNIDTGLEVCEFICLQSSKTVVPGGPAGTSYPVAGTAVPVRGIAGDTGLWWAKGY